MPDSMRMETKCKLTNPSQLRQKYKMVAVNNFFSYHSVALHWKHRCLSRTSQVCTMHRQWNCDQKVSFSVCHVCMYEGESVKMLSVETVANDGNCIFFPIQLHMNIPLLKYIYFHSFVDYCILICFP